jgi:hypothetical protein
MLPAQFGSRQPSLLLLDHPDNLRLRDHWQRAGGLGRQHLEILHDGLPFLDLDGDGIGRPFHHGAKLKSDHLFWRIMMTFAACTNSILR